MATISAEQVLQMIQDGRREMAENPTSTWDYNAEIVDKLKKLASEAVFKDGIKKSGRERILAALKRSIKAEKCGPEYLRNMYQQDGKWCYTNGNYIVRLNDYLDGVPTIVDGVDCKCPVARKVLGEVYAHTPLTDVDYATIKRDFATSEEYTCAGQKKIPIIKLGVNWYSKNVLIDTLDAVSFVGGTVYEKENSFLYVKTEFGDAACMPIKHK